MLNQMDSKWHRWMESVQVCAIEIELVYYKAAKKSMFQLFLL